ncbi:MAG: hypothetical protein HYU41_10500 [Candidatus Rokubacteria bacterium]|nr:hypothetical protein [Candidatus Rokubacteria bacterium]
MRKLIGVTAVVVMLGAAAFAAPAAAQSEMELLGRAAEVLRSQALTIDAAQLDILMNLLGEGQKRGVDVSQYRSMAPGLIKAGAAKLKQMNRESAASELEALANAFLGAR